MKILFFGQNSKFFAPIGTAGEYFYQDSVIFNRKVDCFVNFSSQKFSPLKIFYSPLNFMIPSPWNFFWLRPWPKLLYFSPQNFFPIRKNQRSPKRFLSWLCVQRVYFRVSSILTFHSASFFHSSILSIFFKLVMHFIFSLFFHLRGSKFAIGFGKLLWTFHITSELIIFCKKISI